MFKVLPVLVLSLVAAQLHITSAEPAENKLKTQKLLYASSFTTTFTDISTLTSVIPYTCYTTAKQTKGCKGRKKRRSLRITRDMEDDFGSIADVNSSLDDDIVNIKDGQTNKMAAAEKFFFTVWKTSMTTMTVTSYSTNRSITLSVLAACTNLSFTALPAEC